MLNTEKDGGSSPFLTQTNIPINQNLARYLHSRVVSDDGECLQNEKSTPSGALFILARVDRKDAKSFLEISVFFYNSCISFGLQISISYDLPTVCK